MTAALRNDEIDLTGDEPCDPEPHWSDGIPMCAAACPHFQTMPELGRCALELVVSNSRVHGRVCLPTVHALGRHATDGEPLPDWATPPRRP